MMLSPGLSLIALALLSGCMSSTRFDQCVEERQQKFKAKNPDAPYSQLVNQREAFEKECAHLK